MTHRAEVLEATNGKFASICTCGWRSTNTTTFKGAKLQANDHRLAELAGPKPVEKL